MVVSLARAVMKCGVTVSHRCVSCRTVPRVLRRLFPVRAITLSGSLAAAVLAVTGPSPSAAAELPPITFPETGTASTLTAPGVQSFYEPEVEVAVNAAGDSVAVWTVSQVRASKYLAPEAQLQIAFRPAGAPSAAWSPPATISAPDRIASLPDVGIDAGGNATVAWAESSNDVTLPRRFRVRVATFTGAALVASEAFSADDTVTRAPSLAVAPSGEAAVAFVAETGSADDETRRGVVRVARRSSPTGAFAEPQPVSTDKDNTIGATPALAMNASGRVAVVWTEAPPVGIPSRVRFATASRSDAWSAPLEIADGTRPSVVLDNAGAATVAWSETGLYDEGPVALATRRVSAAGALGARQLLATSESRLPSGFSRIPLGVDASGQVTAAWTIAKPKDPGDPYAPAEQVQVATAPAGGAFDTPITLSDYAREAEPALAVDASGATAVAWGGDRAALSVVWRAAGGTTFQGLGKITDKWVRPASLAFARPHELTVVFGTELSPPFIVQSATTILRPAANAPGPAQAAPDLTAPTVVIRGVEKVLAPKAKRRGKARRFRLVATLAASEAVSVRVVVSQRRKGIRRGGKCVARPSSPKLRKGRKSCTRVVVLGPEVGAPVGIADTSLDLGAAPPKGAYDVTVKATDTAGNRSLPVVQRVVLK